MAQYNGEGTVYFQNIDENMRPVGGWRDVGSAYPFTLQTSTEVAKHISRRADGSAGQTLATLVAPGKDGVTGAMTLYDFKAENLAVALSGAVKPMAAAVTPLTDEDFTMPETVGEYLDLGTGKLTGAVTVSMDSTVLTPGVDYRIEEKLGMIAALAGGALAVGGEAITVSATPAKTTGLQMIQIAAQLQKRVGVKIALNNKVTGQTHAVVLHRVVLSAKKDVPFISSDGQAFESIDLELSAETPAGMNSPGYIDGVPL